MVQSIHIRILRKMLLTGDHVNIKLRTKSREIQCWCIYVHLQYNFYQGSSSSIC